MTLSSSDYMDETSSTVLMNAFQEACARHDISPDGDDGADLLTVLTYAFQKGMTTKDRLLAFAMNLTGK
ncbi:MULTISPECIES: hypothetical protein [Rhizobium]|uniref:hypothetical protein n=1 Tax=Rhizobium TaxID=379 RepID=UPI00195C185A|nr:MULTISPECIES: hypothetical protein [Rhizobium]MBM7044660.1 hypothetical protein [Rhizobium lusitanum]